MGIIRKRREKKEKNGACCSSRSEKCSVLLVEAALFFRNNASPFPEHGLGAFSGPNEVTESNIAIPKDFAHSKFSET